jgi:formamidopyrimidine-DNA glycosylase
MPELAEVETVNNYLALHLAGEKFTSYHQGRGNLRYHLQDDIGSYVIGARVTCARRVAKYIILELDNGYGLIVHLGMTGRLTIRPADYILQKHDHIYIGCASGKKLVFNDARRFGMVYCYMLDDLPTAKIFANTGPDALSADFTPEYFYQNLRNRTSSIKSCLMDNKIVVGIGNIYALESLFMARIHPALRANNLSLAQVIKLVSAAKKVLTEAIKAGGTSLRDFVGGDNKPGYFKQKLLVYGRAALPCYECGSNIIRIKQGGRSSFLCPNCQQENALSNNLAIKKE